MGPDNINQTLAGLFQHFFNLSLKLKKVSQLWKTSCIVPVPKIAPPCSLNDYKPVLLISHL